MIGRSLSDLTYELVPDASFLYRPFGGENYAVDKGENGDSISPALILFQLGDQVSQS